ncbi:MAG TPA: transcription termination factor Rho [Candidatus Fraserbacteria bacterium]|mgnify:CR=1 FL=1|nr:transcription termination factor Rho [Candidatus Fraserbacteria bacterium]
MDITDLRAKDTKALKALADQYDVNGLSRMKKEELIWAILDASARREGLSIKDGVLEVLPDNFGFLRDASCLPGKNDIYVSPSQIKRFSLRDGDVVRGTVRRPKSDEKYFALLKVQQINFQDPNAVRHRSDFGDLTPYHPTEQLKLGYDPEEYSTRIIDLFAPIGKGQRGLIVSPPKAGKTTLLKNLAHGIMANHPTIKLIVLLVDERPEEVTDFKLSLQNGPHDPRYQPEVVAATFDQKPEIHTHITELVIAKAKRLVEHEFDVVILMDSITRLARAYNLSITPSGKLLSGGIDPTALYKPKEFFGAARNLVDLSAERDERDLPRTCGSLTIIGTALVDTGSRLDSVVFEEFKGTGNMELILDRGLSNKRIFPAIDLELTGTRKEELLLDKQTLRKVWILRKMISGSKDKQDALEYIINGMRKTENNEQFLELMKNE